MWRNFAACVGDDPMEWEAETEYAKDVCESCPVKTDCLADALLPVLQGGVGADGGMRGGMTQDERRRLIRKRTRLGARLFVGAS